MSLHNVSPDEQAERTEKFILSLYFSYGVIKWLFLLFLRRYEMAVLILFEQVFNRNSWRMIFEDSVKLHQV